MLRFLTTIKVITTKQRNKFKNNNREGGDKRGEKAPFPSGAQTVGTCELVTTPSNISVTFTEISDADAPM